MGSIEQQIERLERDPLVRSLEMEHEREVRKRELMEMIVTALMQQNASAAAGKVLSEMSDQELMEIVTDCSDGLDVKKLSDDELLALAGTNKEDYEAVMRDFAEASLKGQRR